jgi:hypothetical protein
MRIKIHLSVAASFLITQLNLWGQSIDYEMARKHFVNNGDSILRFKEFEYETDSFPWSDNWRFVCELQDNLKEKRVSKNHVPKDVIYQFQNETISCKFNGSIFFTSKYSKHFVANGIKKEYVLFKLDTHEYKWVMDSGYKDFVLVAEYKRRLGRKNWGVYRYKLFRME